MKRNTKIVAVLIVAIMKTREKSKMTYILGLWVLVWIWIIYDMANTPIYPEDWINEEKNNETK